jgi:hypothetical protein
MPPALVDTTGIPVANDSRIDPGMLSMLELLRKMCASS